MTSRWHYNYSPPPTPFFFPLSICKLTNVCHWKLSYHLILCHWFLPGQYTLAAKINSVLFWRHRVTISFRVNYLSWLIGSLTCILHTSFRWCSGDQLWVQEADHLEGCALRRGLQQASCGGCEERLHWQCHSHDNRHCSHHKGQR